jgi:hypothetical protein
MQTVAEMSEFSRNAGSLLRESEVQTIISYLAEHPAAGVLIAGTGGVRKLRWAREGMGKSGGVRVIYYYHSERIPLYLLTVFGKNEKANLTKAEANALSKLVKLLIQASRIQP